MTTQTLTERAGYLATFERGYQSTLRLLRNYPADKPDIRPVGPKRMGDVRRGDALWMMLYDTIHHRGQLTVYTRKAGGIVPSMYGPTREEPWW